MSIKKFNPTNSVFLWDLHEVLLTKKLSNWLKIGLKSNQKWHALKNLDRKTTHILVTFLLERIRLTKKQVTSEELIDAAKKANNPALIDLIISVCSSYNPISQTVTVMNELSSLNYKHHLGSNIGKTVYESCKSKFSSVFNQFQTYHIPFKNYNNEVIKKPDIRFFTSFLDKHNLKPENVIFIDDKQLNISAAQKVGIHTIHFKNAKELRNKLIEYGILLLR